MKLQLRNIIPEPLVDSVSSNGQVWDKVVNIEQGTYCHILAPSGSGKTTLVNILYGLRKDFSGSLLFDDVDSSSFSINNWSNIRANNIAVVFQDLNLLEDLTALENILLKNQLTNHFSFSEIEQMANQLGIHKKLNSKCSSLSRGEQQRVAIVRSLCMPFEFIVLDEPFSHLDEENTMKAIKLIKDIVAKNKAGLIMANLFADSHFGYDFNYKMV